MATRFRRAKYFALVLVPTCLAIAIWGKSLCVSVCHWQAKQALAQGAYLVAEDRLNWAAALGVRLGQTRFFQAHLARKEGLMQDVPQRLIEAEQQGYDRRLVAREALLADAQSGRIAAVESRLAELLVQGVDLEEVCEAYVRGCLMAYRLDEALRILDVWQLDFPQSPLPFCLRGRILEHRDNTAQAISAYRQALELRPNDTLAAYSLARLFETENKFEEALSHYLLVAQHHFNPQPGLVGASRCLRQLGRLDEAAKSMTAAVAVEQRQLNVAWLVLGDSDKDHLATEWGLVELAQGHPAEAERWFRQALGENPKAWRVRYQLATALNQQSKAAEAAQELEQFSAATTALAECDRLFDRVQAVPSDADARFRIACILREHVSETQGLMWLQTVLDYDPDHQEARAMLASLKTKKIE